MGWPTSAIGGLLRLLKAFYRVAVSCRTPALARILGVWFSWFFLKSFLSGGGFVPNTGAGSYSGRRCRCTSPGCPVRPLVSFRTMRKETSCIRVFGACDCLGVRRIIYIWRYLRGG